MVQLSLSFSYPLSHGSSLLFEKVKYGRMNPGALDPEAGSARSTQVNLSSLLRALNAPSKSDALRSENESLLSFYRGRNGVLHLQKDLKRKAHKKKGLKPRILAPDRRVLSGARGNCSPDLETTLTWNEFPASEDSRLRAWGFEGWRAGG